MNYLNNILSVLQENSFALFLLVVVCALLLKIRTMHRRFETKTHTLDAVKRHASLMTALIENSSDFIGIADIDGTPVYVNPAGRKLVGLDADEPIEKTQIPDYYPEDQQELVKNEIVPEMQSKGHWHGETKFRNFKTGESIPVSDKHFMILDPESGVAIGMGWRA